MQLHRKIDTETFLKLSPPGSRFLSAEEEREVLSVKLPSVTKPLNANTASRYQLLTVTDNDLSVADKIISLRPFSDTPDLLARAANLIRGNRKHIYAG